MASIVDRGKGRPARWQVKYRVWNDDRERWDQRSESFARHDDAKTFKASVEVETAAGTFIDPHLGDTLFGDFAAEVIDTLTRGQRPTTAARTRDALRIQVLPRWRRVPLGSIRHTAVQQWINALTDSGLGPASVHKAWQTFAKVINAAVDARLINDRPWGRVVLPKIERHEARFLTPAEVDQLAAAIGDRWRAFVYVGAVCGLRAGELFGLRWSDVNFDQRWVEVREGVTEADGALHVGAPKTARSRRRVPMPQVVVDELELHRLTAADPDGGLVFPDDDGGHQRAGNFRNRAWKPATVAAGLDGLVIHELRHSAVAGWIDAGATPTEVAARAGHRSVVTILDVYGHRFPAHGERVNDALDAAYAQARQARR